MDVSGDEMTDHKFDDLYTRLNELDRIQAAQGQRLEQVAQSVDSLTTKFDSFIHSYNSQSRTDWRMVASMTGLVLVVWAMSLTPLYERTIRNERNVGDVGAQQFQDYRSTHEELADARERIARLEGRDGGE